MHIDENDNDESNGKSEDYESNRKPKTIDDEIAICLNKKSESKTEQATHKCPICFKKIKLNDIKTIKCGHCYCLNCLKYHVQRLFECSVCKKKYKNGDEHKIYLNFD